MSLSYYTWGSAELAIRAFTALALLAESKIGGALAFAALLGLIITSFSGAFSQTLPRLLAAPKLLVAVVLIAGVLLAPVDVIIVEQMQGNNLIWPSGGSLHPLGERVVANVPAGAALPAAAAAALGRHLTELIETMFGAVDDIERIETAGLWLASRALRAIAATRGNFSDTALPNDFRYYLENCIFFESRSGRLSMKELLSGSVRTELGRSTGGLTSVHQGATGEGQLGPLSCSQAWHGSSGGNYGTTTPGLNERLVAEGHQRRFRACQELMGISLAREIANLDSSRAAARQPQTLGADCGTNVFADAMALFGYSSSVVEAFADVAAAELVKEYAHVLASQKPETIAFAKFSAERQRNASYVIAGELAVSALPALRGLLEATLLVLLPVLLVVGLIFFEQLGAYLKNGLVMLLWLHLWPPVAAVINLAGQWVHVVAASDVAVLSDGLFSVMTIDRIVAKMETQLALSHYLLILTPMLAYALVKSGEIGGALLAGRLLQAGETAAGHAAAGAALNNWTADQVNLAPRTTVGAHEARTIDRYGGSETRYPAMTTQSLPSNDPGFIQARHTQTVTEAVRHSSEIAQSKAQEASTRMARSIESAYEQSFGSEGRQVLTSAREEGISDRTSYRALQAVSEAMSATEHKAHELGLANTFTGSATFSMGGGLDWGISFDAQLSDESRELLTDTYRQSVTSQSEEAQSALREMGSALERAEVSSISTTQLSSASTQVRATLSETQQHANTAAHSEQRAQRLVAASEVANANAASMVQDLLRDPRAANLLAQFHRFYNRDGLPFEQAWAEAQRSANHPLDMDEIVERLLASQPLPAAPAGAPPDREAILADHADALAKIPTPITAPPVPGDMAAYRARLEALRSEDADAAPPATALELSEKEAEATKRFEGGIFHGRPKMPSHRALGKALEHLRDDIAAERDKKAQQRKPADLDN